MTSYVPPIKNGAAGWIGYVSLAPRTATGAWQSNPTLAAGDVKLSIDGGALANLGTLPAVTPASSKLVKITLSQAETNGDNLTIIFSDAAGAEWCDLTINLQTVARQIDDLAFPTVSGRSLDVTATGAAGVDWGNVENPTTAVNLSATNIDVDQVVASVSGAVGSVTGNVGGNVTGSVGSVAAGGITASSIATGAIDADALAADAVAEIADGVWDEDATGHQTGGTFGQAIGDPGADTTTIYQSVVTDAAGTNIAADIVAVKAETASIQSDTNDIQTRLPAALVSGRIDASVGAMAADTLTATALAASAVTEIQSGLSTLDAAGVRTAVGLASANLDTQLTAIDDYLDTEVAAIKAKTDNLPASPAATGDAMTLTSAYDFAKGTVAMTEAYAANGVAPTPVQAFYAIHQMLMQFSIASTTITVKKLDNSTTAFSVTLNDATTPTSAVRT